MATATSISTMRINNPPEDEVGDKKVILQTHPLLIDTVIEHVLHVASPMSLEDILAYGAVCQQWMAYFRPKLYEKLENIQIVFKRDPQSKTINYFYDPPRKCCMTTYLAPMPVSQFLRLQHELRDEFQLEIMFKRFKITDMPINDIKEQSYLWEFFKEFGPSVEELQFDLDLQCWPYTLGLNTTRRILTSCPNLKHLALKASDFTHNKSFVEKEGNEIPPATSIKKLEIFEFHFNFNRGQLLANFIPARLIFMRTSFLKYFLLACPQLEVLNLRECIDSDEHLQNITELPKFPCLKTLKELHIKGIASSVAFYPVISRLHLQSFRIDRIPRVAVRGDADGFFKILKSQSDTLKLLSIGQLEQSDCTLEGPRIGEMPYICFPVMRALKYLQLNLNDQIWKFDAINFRYLFPALKILAIGEIPESAVVAIPQEELETDQLQKTGVEALEFQILYQNPSEIIGLPGYFPNLKVLEISLYLSKYREQQEVRRLWENVVNLESLYLHVVFAYLKKYTLDKFISGLRESECRRLSNSTPSQNPVPTDISRSILNLKKLKHLDIKFTPDCTNHDYGIGGQTKEFSQRFQLYIDYATIWTLSKISTLEYLKISEGSDRLHPKQLLLTEPQVSILETSHPRFQRLEFKPITKGDSYEWKISGVSDPPVKPSMFFKRDFGE